ncbi:MAG: glycosyltransferase [Blastocatellia bacterium]
MAQPIRRMEILLDGQVQSDVPGQTRSSADSKSENLLNSFSAIIQVAPVAAATSADLSLRATLLDGQVLQQRILVLNLIPFETEVAPLPAASFEDAPLVAVCMATYNPPLALFRRQIDSIVRQSHQHWRCIVSDDLSSPESLAAMREVLARDPRFTLSVAPQRAGFYRNFERALSLVPAEAQFVMLCDQDDCWHAGKTETLLTAFGERQVRTTLAYSDMRVVDASGRILSETFWTVRRNNYTDLVSLLLANCVTGAATMFRHELLDLLLPFPPPVSDLYHDHWLGCLALAVGRLEYVDRPLYDYTQHDGNVIGNNAPPRQDFPRLIYYTFREMFSAEGRERARAIYFEKVLKTEALAQALLVRGGNRISPRNRRRLRRLANLEHSWFGWAWLALRGLKGWRRTNETMGAEYLLLLGLTWRCYSALFSSRFGTER